MQHYSSDPRDLPWKYLTKARSFASPLRQELQAVLESLVLWQIVSLRGGLDSDMDASPLSHGQKQLLCVGRSFLMNAEKRILIVDKRTSSLQTE